MVDSEAHACETAMATPEPGRTHVRFRDPTSPSSRGRRVDEPSRSSASCRLNKREAEIAPI